MDRFVDSCAGADGIFVLDTGSADDTVAKLKARGVTVNQEAMPEFRFDVARNKSLEFVPADKSVCLCMDLDEVLAPNWRQSIESAWDDDVNRGSYRYVWKHRPEVVYNHNRLHCRHGFEWRGPTHEALVSLCEERLKFIPHLQIDHFPDESKPRPDDTKLLTLWVEQEPSNPRAVHYLAREHFFKGRFKEAEDGFTWHLHLHLSFPAERMWSMRYLAVIAGSRGDQAQRIEWLRKATAECPDRREAWVDLAKACYDTVDTLGCFYAAGRALRIKERDYSYFTENYAWSELPHDLFSVSAFYIGAKELALDHAVIAHQMRPDDPRLESNIRRIKESVHGSS